MEQLPAYQPPLQDKAYTTLIPSESNRTHWVSIKGQRNTHKSSKLQGYLVEQTKFLTHQCKFIGLWAEAEGEAQMAHITQGWLNELFHK